MGPSQRGPWRRADFGRISTATFIIYKAAFATALGAIVTPLVAARAMTGGRLSHLPTGRPR